MSLILKREQRFGAPLTERIEAMSMPVTESGCWLWMGNVCRDYGYIKVGGLNMRANRASYQAYKGPIPHGLWVLHRCDVRICVNPDHLFLGTRKDNFDDMVRKGRRRVGEGERHASSKLKTDQVLAIRQSTLSDVGLAKIYGVRPWAITQIKRRLTWKHLPA